MIAACGGSALPAADVSPTASGAATASATPSASAGGGGGTSAGIPTIADGAYRSGRTHLEISGGKSDTVDASGAGGFTQSNTTVLVLPSADNKKIVTLSFLAPTESDRGAVAVTTSEYSFVGEWGKECQVRFTRNDASGLSGEFSCRDAPGVAVLTDVMVNVTGTFSVER
jgi:hypothetical protein